MYQFKYIVGYSTTMYRNQLLLCRKVFPNYGISFIDMFCIVMLQLLLYQRILRSFPGLQLPQVRIIPITIIDVIMSHLTLFSYLQLQGVCPS